MSHYLKSGRGAILNYIVFTSFSLLMLGAVSSCKHKNKVQETPALAALPDEFKQFYDKFNTDTTFQMQHIQFPLLGLPSDVDSATVVNQDYYYTADTWVKHKPIDFSKNEFKQEFQIMSDRMIVERVYKQDNTYMVERRFAKISDNQWYLIYYVAPNRFVKKPQ